MSGWVNYGAVKEAVGIQSVLAAYGVTGLRPSGRGQYRGPCPIHGGEGVEAFHVNVERHVFHCFACQAGGNVLDLVAALERCTVYRAACHLRDRFAVQAPAVPAARVAARSRELVTKKRSPNPGWRAVLGELDGAHPYLSERGITPATAAYFAMGYHDGPGWLHGQVAIPIHNAAGQLVAYCGRRLPGPVGPRYRFPAGFAKSLELFNFHRAAATGAAEVVVVEGFFDCLRVHQAGWPAVVALMGLTLSAAQQRLLGERFPRITLMLDGDRAGRAASPVIAARLRPHCVVREVILPLNCQPDGLPESEIKRKLLYDDGSSEGHFTQNY
jgi:DNA primase